MEHNEVNIESAGDKLRINYNGLLAESGADQVYLHAGIGEEWQNTNDIEMSQRESGQWSAELRVNQGGRLNFCFKDSANNWDNNDGEDWSYEIY